MERREIKRILKTLGREVARDMSMIKEPKFRKINNLQAYVVYEISHMDQRRRRKLLSETLSDIIIEECIKFINVGQEHIKTEPKMEQEHFKTEPK